MTFAELYREAVAAPLPPTPRKAFLQKVVDATGCSWHTAVSWTLGRKTIPPVHQQEIARAFGYDIATLFPPDPPPAGHEL